MSIYSGFATRHLQQTYDQYVCDILFVLQKRIIKFYQNIEADQDKFFAILSQLYHQLHNLQKSKYLEPKSSAYILEIYDYLKCKKQQRNQCPEQDLKRFEKSLALKKQQQQLRIKQLQTNNFIKRSSFSFGKIKRQFQNARTINQKSDSSNPKPQLINKSFQKQFHGHNPQLQKQASNSRSNPKRLFSSKGYRNSKSFQEQIPENINEAKIKILKDPAQLIVKEYLQKTNKNYMRGYRKRKIRDQFILNHQSSRPLAKQKRHNL